MKKLFTLFSMLVLSLSVQAAPYKEGEHYKVLDLEPSNKPMVTEFFSFYCPHCNSFEPIIQQLKKKLPDGVELQKNHVSFMGGSMGPAMSKAFATMVALQIEDQMIPVLFNRIHNMRKPPRDEAELRQIFLDEGIEANKFDAAYKGFAIDSMVRRMDKKFENSGLTGVPAIIVNNKYLVQAQGLKSTDEYIALVNYLLTLK
ncbi:thiol:disulfide interchange protein DsbA/DsbL [Vibrio sagamiensis]|uniref:Thiol:disulfide interchange protein n=1 Tax=Vibrio sagamiensis NBRC 104589 TaxID=1219064 RepID=A0A511QII1_9VIBR|nr:thiol:disulfide interchange protein DsbA/DsbL [Vibrio sagamiensis]PNQ71155.1 thiol:disulfide interchange protein DsbA/DsbL [Vibrio agarivorans]GEM76272.1 thiol:disulfide interchange protein [Vibrio sagamiensis NBRC 104589]